ncbi:MAG: ATP-binding protein [Candidatus Omnitrophota bacterium]
MIFRSIRFKIVFWNAILLTLALVVCGALAYKSLKWNLYRNMDDLLISRAAGISASIETYWDIEKQEALDQGVRTGIFSKINNINFTKIARHWVEVESDKPELLNVIIQIFDNHGALLVSSADAAKWPGIAMVPSQGLGAAAGRFDDISIHTLNGKRVDMRSFVIPVREGGQVAYTIRLITPLSDLNAHLLQLRIILYCILPLIIFLTGIVGVFLARVSFYPVDQMVAAINRITSKNLLSHIDVPRTRDEIQRLAETFNAMLDCINTDFLAQQRFIQDISHEIKTPLTIMRGSMEVALKKTRAPERYEKILQDSLEQIARLTRIVETLLVLARFDNHEVTLQIRRFNLVDLTRRVVEEIRVLADEKDVRLGCRDRGPVEIEADDTQIKNLLLNLLDNAVKYTPADGEITVSLGCAGDAALIEVKDTGIGINPGDIPHVFERFYRASGPGIREKGFGLGLSLVKSIVDSHQGRIAVASDMPGGTVFTIMIPLRAAGK